MMYFLLQKYVCRFAAWMQLTVDIHAAVELIASLRFMLGVNLELMFSFLNYCCICMLVSHLHPLVPRWTRWTNRNTRDKSSQGQVSSGPRARVSVSYKPLLCEQKGICNE